MVQISSGKIIRFVLTPLLALWLSGTGCLIGCENMQASSATGERTNLSAMASGDACSSSGRHDCCAKGKSKVSNSHTSLPRPAEETGPSLFGAANETGTMRGCPLAMSRESVLTRVRSNDLGTVEAAHTPITHGGVLQGIVSQSTHLAPPKRSQTYLRCCVLLI
jgi:hypothetical protein